MTPSKLYTFTLILGWVGDKQGRKCIAVCVCMLWSFIEVVVKHAEGYRFKFRGGGIVCYVEGRLASKADGINGGWLQRQSRFAHRN